MNINPKSKLVNMLAEMHTYCRPHGSPAEKLFIARYIAPLPGAYQDEFLNWHVVIGDKPTVLWSSHTDTVHFKNGRQQVELTDDGMLRLSKRDRKNTCLGADDTVGVFLLTQMIEAEIPGHYIFHYGEEAGCIGSSDLAACDPEFFSQFTMAIAFDRGGTDDIITYQMGRRTASDAFAHSLAAQLNADVVCGLKFKPCDTGVYTDTVEYMELIPECTNVSVGYYGAHSSREHVDVKHVLCLLAMLTTLDTSALIVERDPSKGVVWDENTEPVSGVRDSLDSITLKWDDDDDTLPVVRKASDRLAEGFSNTDAVYLDQTYREVQKAFAEQIKDGRYNVPSSWTTMGLQKKADVTAKTTTKTMGKTTVKK